MTPPVRDREQWVEAVDDLLLNGLREMVSRRKLAERIVDALRQPDPEVVSLAELREKAAEGNHAFFVDMHTARVAAEERLRAVQQAARHVVDSKAFYVSTLGAHRSVVPLLAAIDDLQTDLDRVLSGEQESET